MSLEQLLHRTDVWRAREAAPPVVGVPTGFAELHEWFPGGWPRHCLTEILAPGEGVGNLSLMLPALACLSRESRWIAFVAPPYIPYAPALAAAGVDPSRVLLVHPRRDRDGLWAVEQTLRSGNCSAVLAWPAVSDQKSLRRLQLAAEAGGSWGLLFRHTSQARQASPAAVRLQVQPEPHGLSVQVLKRRGGWAAGPVHVKFKNKVKDTG